MYEYIYAEILSIWILRALQVSHPDPWAHNQVSHMCSVCVFVRTHTPTPKHTPTHLQNREDADNTTISPSVKNIPSRQASVKNIPSRQASALID